MCAHRSLQPRFPAEIEPKILMESYSTSRLSARWSAGALRTRALIHCHFEKRWPSASVLNGIGKSRTSLPFSSSAAVQTVSLALRLGFGLS